MVGQGKYRLVIGYSSPPTLHPPPSTREQACITWGSSPVTWPHHANWVRRQVENRYRYESSSSTSSSSSSPSSSSSFPSSNDGE
ncbi:hypothetical protein O3P69_011187 [Scylla paramamosain]|uniref:Uncharacterized protein n=1 Tax=Scylla paramamosain TaxID=85552 RepID=A0AAW0SUK4_SCYPA